MIVWADDTTRFYGNISARGGSLAGDGGFVEVSGKRYLDYKGSTNTSAPNGNFGTLLLDPGNVSIENTASSGIDHTTPGDDQFQPADGASGTILNIGDTGTASTLLGELAGNNVTVLTANNGATSGGEPGNITIVDAIDFNGIGTRTLTLIADNNITVNSGATISDSNATGDTLNLDFQAPSGAIALNAAIDTGGGTFTLDAGGNISQTAAITTTTLNVTNSGGTTILNHASNDVGSLSVDHTGNNSAITFVNSATLQVASLIQGTGTTIDISTNTGNLTMSGSYTIGSGSSLSLTAAGDVDVSSSISTTDATIDITTGNGGTYSQTDVDLSSGNGAITITADIVDITDNTNDNAFQSTGTLTLKPVQANTAMSLAGASAFDLSTTEIADLTGTGTPTTIIIGDGAASTATMTIGGAVGLSGKTLTLNAGAIDDTGTNTITAGTLNLVALAGGTGNIGDNADTIDTTTTTALGITAAGDVYVDESTDWDTDQLTVSLTGGGTQTLSLEANSWDTTSALNIGSDNLVLRSQNGTIDGNGGLLTANTITLANVASDQAIGGNGTEVQVATNTLNASAPGTGGIYITETGSLALDTIGAGTGGTLNTTGGSISGVTNTVSATGGAGGDTFNIALTGFDSLDGTGGDDGFYLTDTLFDAAPTITGGANTDTIHITDTASVVDANFANVLTVEGLTLDTDTTQSVTLAALSDAAGLTTVDATAAVTGTSDVTVDAGGRSNAISISTGAGDDIITAGGGADTIVTGDGTNTINFTSANFTSADTVTGGAGTDTIHITDTATVVDADFTLVANVEGLTLDTDATQSVTLAALSDAAGLTTVDATAAVTGTSDVTVDAGGRSNAISISTGAGDDIITGGGGADTIVTGAGTNTINFASANFTSADTVTGGAGTDTLHITDAATVIDADFTLVTSVEGLTLDADATQSVTLAALSDAAGLTTVDATAAVTGTSDVTVDAGGRSNAISITTGAGADVITSGGAADTIIAGGGSDTVNFTSVNFTSADTVTGGTGTDTIHITDAATVVDADFTLVTGVEGLTLDADATQSVTLAGLSGAAGLTTVDASAAVTGTSDVTVDASSRSIAVSITTGAGADVITSGGGADTIIAGAGDDAIYNIGSGGDNVAGGTGSDTIFGNNAINTWNVTTADAGDIGGTTTFSSVENLTGGTANDTFNLSAGLTGNLTGGAGTGNDTFNLAGNTVGGNVDGGAHTTGDALTGLTNADAGGATEVTGTISNVEIFTGSGTFSGSGTWNIDGADTGTVGGIRFNFANLQGGNAGNIFDFASAGRISGTVAGGTGTDTLDYADVSTSVSVNLLTSAASLINGGIGGGFSSIESFTGGSGMDTLTATNVANVWTIDAVNGGNIGGAFTFAGVESLIGGTDTDAFTLSGGTLCGSIAGGGGAGINTLTADNVPNTWGVTGSDSGTLTGVAGGYSDIDNLVGNANTDAFNISNGVVVSGSIDGVGGSDTLNLSAYLTARSVTLSGLGVTDGFDGNEASVTGGFDNIDVLSLPAGAGDTLTAANIANVWSVTGGDAGSVTSGGQTLSFTGANNLTGGTNTDDFSLSGGGLSGALAGGGGAGVNSLTGDNVANTWSVTALDAGSVTGITGGFSDIDNLIGGTNTDAFTLNGGTLSGSIAGGGGAGINTLTGDNVANTWGVTGNDAGSLTGVTGGVYRYRQPGG